MDADETGFCLGAMSKKILARRGDWIIHEVSGASDHQYITVNVCGNAAGVWLPSPTFYTKGKICTVHGQKEALQGHIMGLANLDGWKR